MRTLWGTDRRSILQTAIQRSISFGAAKRTAPKLAKPLLATLLAGLLVVVPMSPAFAQDAAQNPPSNPAPSSSSAPQGSTIAPVSSLGLGKHSFANSPRMFPNILKPYIPIRVEPPVLTNSPRIEQLISDGKLQISLQDAVELALENSMDIAVQRYYPWIADDSILKAKSGGFGFGTPGAAFASSTANINPFSLNIVTFDPIVTSSVSFADVSTPINNPFLSGTGSSALTGLISHSSQFNNQYSETFLTGTNLTVNWNNTRSSSSAANFFNPVVSSTLSVSFSQPLLNGFGLSVTTRNIRIAKNNRKIADLAFTQQAITTVTNTINAYWELVFARENVQVQQQAVTVAQKLYNDNKKQLEIGTMAPLDVTRAESELATDNQNLIVARTAQLQQEQNLKNAISKDPLAANFVNVQIIPADRPTPPQSIQLAPFADAVKEAFVNRPDVQEQILNVRNGEIDVRATKNALLPLATLTGTFTSTGLAGNSLAFASAAAAGPQVVDANGNPVTVLNSSNVPIPVFVPTATTTVTGVNKTGLSDSLSQVFHNRFPNYTVGLNVTLPLRNRSAQADSVHAQLTQRQLEAQMQQIKNSAVLDVRNTSIALEQGRAQVQAASKARELQQQTFDAEDKKYRLGASTVYNVILTQRDLITAQGTELRALANLAEAKANYERALGRTLQVNSVTIASAKKGDIERDTLIPGTLNGQVVGTEDLFKSLEDKGKSGNR